MKGLVFCSKVDEAKALSEAFNQRGFQTVALDGSSSQQEREIAIEALENDGEGAKLDYIFTVDIFNEGVDIPSVNQIIMLRPTQSSIVFIQQLGRGLRKTEDKEYVVVIDFIGNYANNFLVPIALYGDNSYNKDNLRRLITGGSCSIPGVSTVNFDVITKERIYKSIDQTNMNTKKALVEEYKNLKYKLGRIPQMTDFINYGSRNPYAFVQYSGSYYHFVTSIGEPVHTPLTTRAAAHLSFYSKEVGNAKRIEELIILKMLIEKNEHKLKETTYITIKDVQEYIANKYAYIPSLETLQSAINYLNGEFFVNKDQIKYEKPQTVDMISDTELVIGKDLEEDLKDATFKAFLIDLITYAIDEFETHYKKAIYDDGFIRYHKYSRKDVCRILNWEKDESSTMYGYRAKYNTFPIFVTYHKQDDISETTKYEDCFINKYQFSWMTRSNVTTESKEVEILRNHVKTGLRICLFVKKSDEEGTDFYYMGDVEPLTFMNTTIKNDKQEDKPIVNVTFSLKHAVEDNLYEYMTTNSKN